MELGGAPSQIIGTFLASVTQGQAGGLPVPSAALVGSYARVTDLFGFKTDLVLCTAYAMTGGTKYFWEPLRPAVPNIVPVLADQNMTLRPLVSPTMLRLTGGMTANRTITADKTNAYPGLTWEIKMDGALNLLTLTVAGLALGNVLTMLTGGSRRLVFDGNDYQSY